MGSCHVEGGVLRPPPPGKQTDRARGRGGVTCDRLLPSHSPDVRPFQMGTRQAARLRPDTQGAESPSGNVSVQRQTETKLGVISKKQPPPPTPHPTRLLLVLMQIQSDGLCCVRFEPTARGRSRNNVLKSPSLSFLLEC